MQEDIENRTLTLVVSATKFTGRTLATAINKYMAHHRERKNLKTAKKAQKSAVVHRGKKSVKELTAQNQGLSNVEVNDKSTRDFERVARKYGVDYAIKKDRSTDPPKFLIFFKANDTGAITAAFSEYSARRVRKQSRPSVLAKLRAFAAKVKAQPKRERRKERER